MLPEALDVLLSDAVFPVARTEPGARRLGPVEVARAALELARLEGDDVLFVLPSRDGRGVADWSLAVRWQPPRSWRRVGTLPGVEDGQPRRGDVLWAAEAIRRVLRRPCGPGNVGHLPLAVVGT